MATAHTSPSDHDAESSLDTTVNRREQRAQSEEMDIALLRQGGIYEVRSESGGVYTVDLLNQTCSCPDDEENDPPGGCKHYRRVRTEVRAGTVPRPDGKLPTGTDQQPADEDAIQNLRAAEAVQMKGQLVEAMLEREIEKKRLHSEINDLQFIASTLEEIGPDTGFNFFQHLNCENSSRSRD